MAEKNHNLLTQQTTVHPLTRSNFSIQCAHFSQKVSAFQYLYKYIFLFKTSIIRITS